MRFKHFADAVEDMEITANFGGQDWICRNADGARFSIATIYTDGSRPMASELPRFRDKCWYERRAL